jgi:hypothetical protein
MSNITDLRTNLRTTYLKIDPNAKVHFRNEDDSIATPGSTIGSDGERSALFGSAKYITISANEDYDPLDMASTRVDINASTRIFNDSTRNIVLTPIYTRSDVTIDFEYRTHSKSEALGWRDNIRLQISRLGTTTILDLDYHFLIPKSFLQLLEEINYIKEEQDPEGEEFIDYLKRCSTTRLTMIGSIAAHDYQFVIQERQARVLGFYDFSPLPEKIERDVGDGIWKVKFTYKFSYDKPAHMTMSYPVIINNKLLPPKYVEFVLDNVDYMRQPLNTEAIRDGLFTFENRQLHNYLNYNPNFTIRIPEFDLFEPRDKPKSSIATLSVLVELSKTNKKELFNLRELGDVELDEDILEFILAEEHQYITQSYKSLLSLVLYENDTVLPNGILECSSTGELTSSVDLNFRKAYRVQLLVHGNLETILPTAFERLSKYPKALDKVIAIINSGINNLVVAAKAGVHGVVNKAELNFIYYLLTGKSLFAQNGAYADGSNLSIASNVVSNTNIRPDFARGVVNFATTIEDDLRNRSLIGSSSPILMKTKKELADQYGLFTPQFIADLRNVLTVQPRVARVNTIAVTLPRHN